MLSWGIFGAEKVWSSCGTDVLSWKVLPIIYSISLILKKKFVSIMSVSQLSVKINKIHTMAAWGFPVCVFKFFLHFLLTNNIKIAHEKHFLGGRTDFFANFCNLTYLFTLQRTLHHSYYRLKIFEKSYVSVKIWKIAFENLTLGEPFSD